MTVWTLVKEAGAIASALAGLLGIVWWLIKPRVVGWVRHQLINPVQETHASITVNGHVSDTPTLRDQVDTLMDRSETNATSIGEIRDELRDHGDKSRAAMAIYRAALADQGIHLPVAPGEDGYGLREEPR